MDEFLFFLLILIPILLIGIPILLSIWIYRMMKKKGLNPKWRILSFLPVIIATYFVYDAFYPSSVFYKADFQEVAGIALSESADFEFKSASYPDTHGDYTSVALIEVDKEFYEMLPSSLIENGLTQTGNRIGHSQMDAALSRLNDRKIEKEFSKEDGDKFYYIAFLSDKKTILVQRSSH